MKVDLVFHAKRKGLFLVHPSDDLHSSLSVKLAYITEIVLSRHAANYHCQVSCGSNIFLQCV